MQKDLQAGIHVASVAYIFYSLDFVLHEDSWVFEMQREGVLAELGKQIGVFANSQIIFVVLVNQVNSKSVL